jgi:hypothetical protein
MEVKNTLSNRIQNSLLEQAWFFGSRIALASGGKIVAASQASAAQ